MRTSLSLLLLALLPVALCLYNPAPSYLDEGQLDIVIRYMNITEQISNAVLIKMNVKTKCLVVHMSVWIPQQTLATINIFFLLPSLNSHCFGSATITEVFLKSIVKCLVYRCSICTVSYGNVVCISLYYIVKLYIFTTVFT